MSDYQAILEVLAKNQLSFLVTGTWAVKQVFPEKLKDYQVADCDIIMPNDILQIRKAIKLLNSLQWETSVWEEIVDENVSEKFLKGKYYIRCRYQQLTLDITYENDHFSWSELNDNTSYCANYQMVALDKILKLKKIKGRPVDHEVIRLFKQFEI